MIFVEPAHKIIREALEARFASDKASTVDIKTGDFDGSHYNVVSDPDAKGVIYVSVYVKCAEELKKYGLQDVVKAKYGDLVVEPREGYSVTLKIDCDNLSEEQKKKYLEDVPLIKRYTMMAPLSTTFDKFNKNEKFGDVKVQYRENESMYVLPSKDALIIIFSLRFKDPDDVILAKVFLQEFQDARRDKEVSNAPAVNFSHKVKPLELKNVPETEDEKTGFVSFVLFKRHIDAAHMIKTIDSLLLFRVYFHYHLKCAKAYMHIRMRDRVAKSLQVLNRAKVEEVAPKQMKTASGRTFNRT